MKAKNPWYSEIKRRIGEGRWKKPVTFQDYVLMKAVLEARLETEHLPNGELRLQAIEEILIKKSKNYQAFARDNYYDSRTVQRWINSYVNLVGKKAGY